MFKGTPNLNKRENSLAVVGFLVTLALPRVLEAHLVLGQPQKQGCVQWQKL